MIFLLIGGSLLCGLSLIVLINISRVIQGGQRGLKEFGISERMPFHPQSKLIITAWSIVMVGGLTMLGFYVTH